MDYFAAFDISGSGLAVEKLRSDLVALNIANANSTTSSANESYRALKLYTASGTKSLSQLNFNSIYEQNNNLGIQVLSVERDTADPKKIYEPNNPLSDANGFVYRPNINPASEMIEMMSALRAYQANIKAISAAKVMAEEAIRISSGR